jgi:UDPglucose 6-dehydrogenase
VNRRQKEVLFQKINRHFRGDLAGKTIALWGLAFKPNTDDMREAPSIALVTALQDMGAQVRVYDPVGMEQAKTVLTDVTYCDGPYSCAEDADALVIVTEWEQFRALDIDRLKQIMACPVLIDLRNVYRPEDVISAGFFYDSIGRPAPVSFAIQPLNRLALVG